MDQTNTFRLVLSSHPKNVSMIEPYVERVVKEYAVREDLYGNILVALTEAVNNAIIHGNQKQESRVVKITSNDGASELSITVEDEGIGFNPNNIPDPTSPENICCEGGRGVFLMKKICDKIEFEKAGATVKMCFHK